MQLRLSWTGMLAGTFLGLAACEGPPEQVDTKPNDLIEVVRVSHGDSAETPVVTRTTVSRTVVDSMLAGRKAALAAANQGAPTTGVRVLPATEKPLATSHDGVIQPSDLAQTSAALTEVSCSVEGQAAGSHCAFPCSGPDLWIYDQPNRIGHRMLCLETLPHGQGYYLPAIPHDPQGPDQNGWNWEATSAWGGSAPATFICEFGITLSRDGSGASVAQTVVGTFQIVNNLNCVAPNSRNEIDNVAVVKF